MALDNLSNLSRTLSLDGKDITIVRPGIGLVLYSTTDFSTLLDATMEVILAYLDFIPSGAIATMYEPSPDEDEYTPGQWVAFDSAHRSQLFDELRAASSSKDDAYRFVLSSTADGQAGDYAISFAGINFAAEDNHDNNTSVLRLEYAYPTIDEKLVEDIYKHIVKLTELFPFSCGHAGMSFVHTISYVPEARKEIDKLVPRFLGFDSSHEAMRLEMRGKSPPAHWINVLDSDLVKALGGEDELRSELDGCDVKQVGSGIFIRAARLPPIVDANRGGLDIGRLPTVARALEPIRFNQGLFVGLHDAEAGRRWLERFDNLAPRDWDNG